MSSPFIVNDLPDGCWSVTWTDLGSINTFSMKNKVLDVVFGELNFVEVGFGIAMKHEETYIMWLDCIVWAQDVDHHNAEYFHDMYDLRGLVFRKEQEALKMLDWLEKKYVWSILCD